MKDLGRVQLYPALPPRAAVKPYSAFVQIEISWRVWLVPAAASQAVSARHLCRAQPGTWIPSETSVFSVSASSDRTAP